ncbi:DNA alkylation repair protein [Myxococcus sp. Y35]|uniref:DNA alkylation repair protein n=1 Tax=Pseudomyxococcus flavus TaxID=3115648 RepID=UPI003CE73B76
MPTKKTAAPRAPAADAEARAQEALVELRRLANPATRQGLARFGIPADHALGVAMRDVQALARKLGRDHPLTAALWKTGVYEARLLCAYVGEASQVTLTEMNRWCRDFDNWAVCDTLCFALWVRSPHAWNRVHAWSSHRDEFIKRAAFALLASLAVHDKAAEDARFLEALPLIERESTDARNFAKKAVNWALRAIGSRRSPALRGAARELAAKLGDSRDATARWNGKDALRAFAKADARAPVKRAASSSAASTPKPAKARGGGATAAKQRA